MKIFKLKYLALSIVLATLSSCSKDYDLKEADKTATADSNSFVFEEGINNYVVDGQLVYDRKQIANAAKNPWNIHYDFPHNKVVISTTPVEFEKYKNSNIEFKTMLDDNAKTPESTTEISDNSQKITTNSSVFTDVTKFEYHLQNNRKKPVLFMRWSERAGSNNRFNVGYTNTTYSNATKLFYISNIKDNSYHCRYKVDTAEKIYLDGPNDTQNKVNFDFHRIFNNSGYNGTGVNTNGDLEKYSLIFYYRNPLKTPVTRTFYAHSLLVGQSVSLTFRDHYYTTFTPGLFPFTPYSMN